MTYLAFPRLFAHASCPSGEAMFVLQFLLFGNYILMFWYLAVCLLIAAVGWLFRWSKHF